MKIIDENLLLEFRNSRRCQWCGKATPTGCDPHHLFARGLGGGSRLDIRCNLIALCRLCHQLVHSGELARHDLLAVVAAREQTTQSEIEQRIWELRRKPKKGA